MLSYGITALQLMPEESTSVLVIITDGILDVPNLSAFEVVMRQIRARIISCSFVQIGSNNNRQQSTNNKVINAPIASLGHVPNEELLKFISLSTFGSFIYFDVDNSSRGESTLLTRLFSHECKLLNEFQNELLSWGKIEIGVFCFYLYKSTSFYDLGFHKALSEHNISLSKRISNGTSSIDDENNRNKYDHQFSMIELKFIFLCPFFLVNHKNFTCELILSSESIVDDVECVLNVLLILITLCRSSVASFKLFIISRQTVSNVDRVNRYPFI
ncbi:unnamed protein product [Rotaria sp. Silwood2]|nr:unnamed protein product [Rotaria sp. Silwood2]